VTAKPTAPVDTAELRHDWAGCVCVRCRAADELDQARRTIATALEHAEWLKRNVRYPTDGKLVRRVLELWAALRADPVEPKGAARDAL
jgi:hypothetical protein